MPQVQRISRNNTKVARFGNRTVVTLHRTDIVDYDAEEIRLDTGGWNTATTRTRMNQVSNQEGLGYQVGIRNGLLHVRWNGEDIPFSRTISLSRTA